MKSLRRFEAVAEEVASRYGTCDEAKLDPFLPSEPNVPPPLPRTAVDPTTSPPEPRPTVLSAAEQPPAGPLKITVLPPEAPTRVEAAKAPPAIELKLFGQPIDPAVVVAGIIGLLLGMLGC